MAFKIPGAKPGYVPHSSCASVQLSSCSAVSQEALCCLSPREPPGCKSPSSPQCSRAHPVPSFHAGMCSVTQAAMSYSRGSSAVTPAAWGLSWAEDFSISLHQQG